MIFDISPSYFRKMNQSDNKQGWKVLLKTMNIFVIQVKLQSISSWSSEYWHCLKKEVDIIENATLERQEQHMRLFDMLKQYLIWSSLCLLQDHSVVRNWRIKREPIFGFFLPFSALLPFSGPFHIRSITNQALKSGSEGWLWQLDTLGFHKKQGHQNQP